MREGRRLAGCAAVIVLTWVLGARADEDNLGGPGESCRARSDCKHGLKCLANVCTDEHQGETCGATSECGTLKCIDNRCVNPNAAPPATTTPPVQQPPPVQPPPVQPPPVQQQVEHPVVQPELTEPEPAPPSHAFDEWVHFQLKGIHPFVGLMLGVGFLNGGYTASQGTLWGGGADGSFLLALRGGVLLDHHEIAIEIAPFTDFWDLSVGPGPAFEANVSYGYLVPLITKPTAGMSWPLRVGIGVLAGGSNTGGNAFFEVRADVIGLTFNTGHVLLELNAPSFRYALTNGHVPGIAVEGVTTNYLSFFFGGSASYAF